MYPHLRKGAFRGRLRVTANGIIRAPLLKYDRHGKIHEVVPMRSRHGLQKLFVLHPAHRSRRPMIHGGEVIERGFPNPEVEGGRARKQKKPVNYNKIPSMLNSMFTK